MSNKKQFVRMMLLMAFLFLGGVYYLYTLIDKAGDRWPSRNKPRTLTYVVNQLNTDVQRLRTEVAKIEPAKKTLAAITVEYDLASRVLPRESSPDQLLAAIRTKALQAGVTPDRVAPTVSAGRATGRGRSASFEEWRFALRIRGTYDQIATFINRMEEFESNDPARTASEKRFFQVQNIDIAAEQNGLADLSGGRRSMAPEQRGHQCNLTMSTYRYTGGK